MKKLIVLCLLFAAVFVLAGSYLTVPTSGREVKLRHSLNPISGRYMVMLKSDVTGAKAVEPEVAAEAAFLSSVYGGEVQGVYSNALKGYVATMSDAQAEALSRDDRVALVEQDSEVWASESQANAPWNLDRVDQRNLPMDTTFGYSQTGVGAHVYIIDTGIRITNQEFGGRASVVFDAVNDGQNGNDCNGHGTHVAGTAVGATYGIAKNAQVHAVRVLNCTGGGSLSNIVAAIDWITAHRVNPAVANISVTAVGESPTMETALANSYASGVVYTVAAGNAAGDACNYSPARAPSAITVGASWQIDARAQFSNYGQCLDLFAPGYEIVSAGISSDTATAMKNGTSMAAPLVAGVVAVYRAANPSASSATVTSAVVNATTNGTVTNIDGTSPNKLLYSWLTGGPSPTPTPSPSATPTPTPSPAPSTQGRITIRKRVQSTSGGTSSTTTFPYEATNISTTNFALISNEEFSDSNVSANGQVVTVTEDYVAGWQLMSIQCVETAGTTPNTVNTTVDLTNHRANIMVESDETVTCTFTSEELAPTAGNATVTGQVADSRGRGVRGVTLSLFNPQTGEIVYATTNSLGYYILEELEVSTFYVLTAYGTKRFSIVDPQRTFTLNDDLAGVDFLAERD
jgi:subtilisin family serine protease